MGPDHDDHDDPFRPVETLGELFDMLCSIGGVHGGLFVSGDVPVYFEDRDNVSRHARWYEYKNGAIHIHLWWPHERHDNPPF